jgi:hypothetical protein
MQKLDFKALTLSADVNLSYQLAKKRNKQAFTLAKSSVMSRI